MGRPKTTPVIGVPAPPRGWPVFIRTVIDALDADQYVPCANSTRLPSELWLSSWHSDQRRAARGCLGCSVFKDCWQYAQAAPRSAGVLAGLTPAERKGPNWKKRAKRKLAAAGRTTGPIQPRYRATPPPTEESTMSTTNHQINPELGNELADVAGLIIAEVRGDSSATQAVIRQLGEDRALGETLRLLHLALIAGGAAVGKEVVAEAEAAAAADRTPTVPASLEYLVALARSSGG